MRMNALHQGRNVGCTAGARGRIGEGAGHGGGDKVLTFRGSVHVQGVRKTKVRLLEEG